MNGIHVPLITPFDETGDVALRVLDREAHDALAAGAAGLVGLGTTGEPGSLSAAERTSILDVLTGIGAPLTIGANTRAELDELRGRPTVTAALTLVPPFLRPGEDGVVAHFEALIQVSPVPIVVYHVPYRTGQQLSAHTLRRLAAIDGIIGVKYATGGVDPDVIDLLADPPPDFAILCGDDAVTSPMLALGAAGAILTSANVAPGAFTDLAAAWRDGDTTRARTLGARLARMSAALFAEPNPAVVKAVLHATGRIPTPAVRLPLLPATAASLRAALSAATLPAHR
ncbi:dihydrodipicolinate synthase family protein [Actinoplanes rectilineatus]|uniref:dihydrodipicolinate synthase family protein n=1 Tax=Actinoplanes rectilineatus TaxID=113571 RepID=UPI0005F2D91D|nr:dihydrodipicolinate synthase family protein [Actinoplanes rectilineatus]